MTYQELFAVTDLLNDIRQGRPVKINNNTKVDLEAAEDYFRNIISHVDKQVAKGKESVVYYRLAIEVKR